MESGFICSTTASVVVVEERGFMESGFICSGKRTDEEQA